MSYDLRLRTIARCLLGAFATATLFTATQVQADVVIDDFSEIGTPMPWPAVLSGNDSANISETGLSSSGVIGGARRTSITSQGSGVTGAAAGGGFFDFSSTTGNSGVVRFDYDAGGAPGGLDMDHTNFSHIVVEFALYSPFQSSSMPVSVTLDDGTISSVRTQSVTQLTGEAVHFELQDFANIGAMDNIHTISVEMDAAAGTDFRISTMYAVVPAPGAVALLALAGVCPRRRRRNA